jgi:hypothetical protein
LNVLPATQLAVLPREGIGRRVFPTEKTLKKGWTKDGDHGWLKDLAPKNVTHSLGPLDFRK